MNAEAKFLSLTVILQTCVVAAGYLFAIVLKDVIMPAPVWTQVVARRGLTFLLLPVITGLTGATLLAKGKEQHLALAVVSISIVAIGAFIVIVELMAQSQGPTM